MAPFRSNNLVDDRKKKIKKGPTIINLEPHHDDEEQHKILDDDDDNRTEVTTIISSQHDRVTQTVSTDRIGDTNNNVLRFTVFGLGFLSSLLIGYILGVTITASGLSSSSSSNGLLLGNADIDPHTGIAYAHDGLEHPVLKTQDAILYKSDTNYVAWSNDELKVLKEILLDRGNVKFIVKGFGRGFISAAQNKNKPIVNIIVEGGTLTWDESGIVDSTGEAVNMILDSAFPQQLDYDVTKDGRHQRRLPTACDSPTEAPVEESEDYDYESNKEEQAVSGKSGIGSF